ncbi:MAG: hypothetical protein AAFY50_19430 [Cyanobacteria bacterium J06648_1]
MNYTQSTLLIYHLLLNIEHLADSFFSYTKRIKTKIIIVEEVIVL